MDEEEEHEDGGERGVNVGGELAATVGVAEEVACDGEDGTEGLEGDVEAGADDLSGWRRCEWLLKGGKGGEGKG